MIIALAEAFAEIKDPFPEDLPIGVLLENEKCRHPDVSIMIHKVFGNELKWLPKIPYKYFIDYIGDLNDQHLVLLYKEMKILGDKKLE